MKINFLEKNIDKDKLILIFPGWSCGKELHGDFHFKGWDKAIVENYEEASLDISPLIQYSTIYLFAWSLGVFMASTVDFKGHITSAFALNGTETPAHDQHGIPLEIFQKTTDNLSPGSLLKFRRRMAGSNSLFNQLFKRTFSNEETEILKSQLQSILKWQTEKNGQSIPWKKVFISEKDAIFPSQNMKRFWETRNEAHQIEIVALDEGHYYPLESLIRLVIPQQDKVSRNFSNAKDSYNRQALAQRNLASLLCNQLKEAGMKKGENVLEVGSGTGLFTKEIIQEFIPRRLDLVDISDVRPDTSGISSNFFQCDAEKWIAEEGENYDAIVSSATVQWFVNLRKFIKNVAERLEEGGIFGFSTFLPGNLEELNTLRPSPLHYHSKEEITEWMQPYFDNIVSSTSTFQLNFDSPSALLRHLKETGVAGSAPTNKIPLSKIKAINTLTFRCVCFTGIKKNKKS